MTSDSFFAAFLAGLKLVEHHQRLTGSRVALNRAFYRACQDHGGFVNRDKLEIDFDPLYGVSPWFERALTRAQRDLLIRFPNPTYATIELKIDQVEAEEILADTGHRAEFLDLAQAFVRNIPEELERV